MPFMKRRSFLHTAGASGLIGIAMGTGADQAQAASRKKLFSFIHFTDVHLMPEQGSKEGFLKAIAKMNSYKVDFMVGGGDLVRDALAADEARATMLYDLYLECAKNIQAPLYHVMGNHEMFGISVPDKVPLNHPLWGKEMFKKRIGAGATYRSFDHKGIHFVLLDSVGMVKNNDNPGYRYFAELGTEQLAWLKKDLDQLKPDTPVIGITHIPFFTYYSQIQNGPNAPNPDNIAVTDGKMLFDILSSRRFFGLLQGHIHVNELYVYKGIEFIVTGAVCAAWWTGPLDGHPEGFNIVTVWNDGIPAEDIPYGWDASQYKHPEKKTEIYPEWLMKTGRFV
jgi:3',5'-cyclic-AMP phosphodiesterase